MTGTTGYNKVKTDELFQKKDDLDSDVTSLVDDPESGLATQLNATYGALRTYDAKVFGGAIGDGVTDDRQAIQDCLDAANAAGGGIVYVPEGDYLMVRPSPTAVSLLTVYSNTILRGAGRDVTHLFLDPTTATSTTGLVGVRIGEVAVSVSNVTVEDIELTMNTSIINEGEAGANQLWGIAARFDGGSAGATALLHADHITVRRCRVIDSRIAIGTARTGVTDEPGLDDFSKMWTVEDNEIFGTWNRAVEFAFCRSLVFRRNRIRSAGYVHFVYYSHHIWVEDNAIDYGQDEYSMAEDGLTFNPGASGGSADGIWISSGVHHVWLTRNAVVAWPGSSSGITGRALNFRCESVAEDFNIHHIYSTENRWSNPVASNKRVLDITVASATPTLTIDHVTFTRDQFEGVVKPYSATNNDRLELDLWRFESCEFTEPLDTDDGSDLTATGVTFVECEFTGTATTLNHPGWEFSRCTWENPMALAATADGTKLNQPRSAVSTSLATAVITNTPSFARKTAATSVTGTSSVANDAELLLPVEAYSVYRVRALLIYRSPTTADFKFGFAAPSGATLTWAAQIGTTGLSSGTGSNNTWDAKALADTASGGGVGSSSKYGAVVEGLLVVGATSGTLYVQWAQNTPDAGNTYVDADSYLALERVA